MIRLQLNIKKAGNYAFFCPQSLLHLTLSNPVGYTDRVTPAILKAIRSGTLLDIDSVINIETGTFIEPESLNEELEPAKPGKRARKTTGQKEELI